MRRTNIYLDERQTRAMDELAAQDGVSRAQIVRQLIDQGLAGRSASTASATAAIFASFGVLRDIDPPARGLTERDQYLDGLWRS